MKVKLLAAGAKAPTVAHPGEDIGYDLYALENCVLVPGVVQSVRTGISVDATDHYWKPCGLFVKDRSSMASKGVFTHGGVIDAGYRGEIIVLLDYKAGEPYYITAGDKIAQMVPVPVLTGEVKVVEDLTKASRGEKGFGSSGH